jgi:CubicO group peptidase (beta-lactamase class C family)
MHQRCRHSLLIFVATLVLLNSLWSPSARAAAVAGSSSATEDDRDRFVTVLDERMPDLLVKYGVPGSIIAGIKDGRVAWTRAYGVANRATGERMQADMLVEHGSNGKAVTAWAVAKLVEAGKVDLDEPANIYLKRWQLTSTAYDANAVTVRQLLNHTSGLNIYGYLDYSPRRALTPSLIQVLDGIHLQEGVNESLMSGRLSSGRAGIAQQPGSGFRYSGAAYTVLQVLIEDVADESFDVFVQREITDPLGARSMRWEWSPDLRAAAARPHGNEGQVLEYRQLASHAIGSEISPVLSLLQSRGPTGSLPAEAFLSPRRCRC